MGCFFYIHHSAFYNFMIGIVIQRLALQFILDVILFPIWWYTEGLRRVSLGLWNNLQDTNLTLSPGLWLKNIFKPMYGQTDFQGRLMSFFMRTVNFIGRSIALVLWFTILMFVLVFWLIIPVFVMFMIVRVYIMQ